MANVLQLLAAAPAGKSSRVRGACMCIEAAAPYAHTPATAAPRVGRRPALFDTLPDLNTRRAFLRTLRSVVDWRGQAITMLDRCYLTQGMPTLLIWGSRDAVIPAHHAHIAHAAMPGSELAVFERAGHFPFRQEPARFVESVRLFVEQTQPAPYSSSQWRLLLRRGPADHPPPPRAH